MKKLLLFVVLLVSASNYILAQKADTDSIVVHELGNVSVKGHLPLVKAKQGKLIYDVSSFAKQHAATNAYDALTQIPGVYDQNGDLKLAGSGNFNIIINGKLSTMTVDQIKTLLKNMPVSKLKSAEVMLTTPPEYHVRGASINLIMANGLGEETHVDGEAHLDYSQYHYANMEGGGDFRFSSPKLSVDMLYNGAYSHKHSGQDMRTIHTLGDKTYNIDQSSMQSNKGWTHSVRSELDYKFDDKNQLAMTYTGELSPKSIEDMNSAGNIARSINHLDESNYLHNISIDFSHGENVKMGMDYTHYQSDYTQNFNNLDSLNSTSSFQAKSRQRVNKLNAYADFVTPIDSVSQLVYGGKLSYATDKNYQHYFSQKIYDIPDDYSKVTEQIYDLYVGLRHSFGTKLSTEFTMNGEYYKIGDYHAWTLFPTFSLSYTLSPSHVFQFALSTDREYPSYWEMQNSRTYIDAYTVAIGNPELRPSHNYSTQMTYIFRQKYIFNIEYSYDKDIARQLAYLSPDSLALIYQTQNWDYDKNISVSSIIPVEFGSFLNSRFTINGTYQQDKDSHYYDMSFNRHKLFLYAGLDNSLKLSPSLQLNIDGMYMTSPLQGLYDLTSFWGVNAGLKWTFAHHNADLTLKGNDIFNTSYCNVRMNQGLQRLHMNFIPDNRYVSLSFVYRFGGYKAKAHKKLDTSRFGQK